MSKLGYGPATTTNGSNDVSQSDMEEKRQRDAAAALERETRQAEMRQRAMARADNCPTCGVPNPLGTPCQH